MKSTAIVSAIAAAALSFSSLSFAQGFDRDQRGPVRDQRAEQRGPQDRDGRGFDQRNDRRDDRRNDRRYDNRDDRRADGPRGFDQRDARNDRNDRQFRHYNARGPEFRRGGHVPSYYRSNQYVVNDWRGHHLHAPQRGQQWVQVGSDYVLIAIATGLIASMVLNSQ